MNLHSLLAERRLRPHKTTKQEIENLLGVAERDLIDAAVPGLSTDRSFLIAYEAALALATIPLYCAGYETYGKGHHWLTFRLLPEVMGEEVVELAAYFDQCRAKRNVGTYDRGGQISESEVNELLREADGFKGMVEDWLTRKRPDFL
jgi:hypothetical protein